MKVVVGLVLVVLGTLLPPTLAQSSGKIHLRMACKSGKRYSRLSLKVPLVGGLIHSIPTLFLSYSCRGCVWYHDDSMCV